MDTSARRRAATALTELRRRVLRRRRPLAALLAAGAVTAGLHALAPPDPPSVSVLVAGHDLPAGHLLARGDLAEVAVPAGAVPAGAVDRAEGRTLAAPLRAGEPVTDVRLVGAGLADAQPAGSVAAPVRLSDPGQAELLTVGDRVDLLATDPRGGNARPLADDALVLALPETGTTSDGTLPGRLVVLAVPVADVEEVTAASVASYVTYTWRRR